MKLEQAARQVLEALVAERRLWAEVNRESPAMELAITALQEALAEQEEPINKFDSILSWANSCPIKQPILAEQAEQEPVAWMFVNDDGECEEIGYGKDYLKGSECMADFQPLFAAPVRTKDLTDDELFELWEKSNGNLDFARAVIQEYRRKNGTT